MKNQEYRDSVFRTIFNNKQRALELYNILYETDYDNPEMVKLITLEDVLFTPRKNDLAFLMEDKFIIVIEHQSTINENMPIRLLLYIARLYEKILASENIYRRKQISLPTPEFIVLYNGEDNLCIHRKKVTEKILKLSDAFKEKLKDIPLELMVKVIDIRYSSQHKILQQRSILKEYSEFVEVVYEEQKIEEEKEKAFQKAIKKCIERNILKEFLERNSSEVLNMLTLEYNEEVAKRIEREEAREEGREEGIKGTVSVLKELNIPLQTILVKIQEQYNLSSEEAEKYL